MSQDLHDASIAVLKGLDNLQCNIELDFRKILPAREFARIIWCELFEMYCLFYLFIWNDHVMSLPLIVFPYQQARIVEFDTDAALVEITLLLPPAKAAVMRDSVERQELDNPPIPTNQEVSANA